MPDMARAQGRFRQRILVDTCQVKAIDVAGGVAVAGEEQFDEASGTYGPPGGVEDDADALVYEGDCAVQPAPMNRLQNREGVVYVGPDRQYEAFLPIDVVNVRTGHILKVTVSRNDPGLVGRFFRVGDALAGTMPIARHLQLREVTEGETDFGRW